MKCIAILETSNYVYKLEAALERKGYKFDIVSTPCHIAKGGCGLCLKFPEEYLPVIKNEAVLCNTPVKAVYRVVPGLTKNRYQRIN